MIFGLSNREEVKQICDAISVIMIFITMLGDKHPNSKRKSIGGNANFDYC